MKMRIRISRNSTTDRKQYRGAENMAAFRCLVWSVSVIHRFELVQEHSHLWLDEKFLSGLNLDEL